MVANGFYLYLGYAAASLLLTVGALAVVVLIAYLFALHEIHQERKAHTRKENRNA